MDQVFNDPKFRKLIVYGPTDRLTCLWRKRNIFSMSALNYILFINVMIFFWVYMQILIEKIILNYIKTIYVPS